MFTKFLLMTVLLLLFGAARAPQTALGHTLKVDRAVGITVHVEPNDEPRVGTESQFFVSFNDTSGMLTQDKLTLCRCVLTIQKDETVILQRSFVTGGAVAPVEFTFDTAGIYSVVVSASPDDETEFTAFSQTFPIYVAGPADTTSSQNELLRYVPFVLGSGIVALFIVLFRMNVAHKQPERK